MFEPRSDTKEEAACINYMRHDLSISGRLNEKYNAEFDYMHVTDPTLSLDDHTGLTLVRGSNLIPEGRFEVPVPWKQNPEILDAIPEFDNVIIKRTAGLKAYFQNHRSIDIILLSDENLSKRNINSRL